MSDSEEVFLDSDGSDDDFDLSADENPASKASKAKSKPLGDASNRSDGKNAAKITDASTQYQKLSQLEHILKRPDTYIGSVEKTEVEMWCFDEASNGMVYKKIEIVPGLYKIFDEILVNAADNKIRDPSMRNIRVRIDIENNSIEVMNDGKGIPVQIHKKEKIYIPEMIFGNLLTSSNYDDDQKKVTGGRNGYGAKLCNIFSSEFSVETADIETGQLYKQVWNNNMSKVSNPKITKLKSKKEYTKIRFKPDLSKFGMDFLDNDILSVLRRRVYDLCGTVKDCNIYLNDKKIDIRNFKGYIDMYVKAIRERSQTSGTPEAESENNSNASTIVYENLNDRFELAFALSDGNFNQVSFVNSIATTTGGTHIRYISDQIVNKLTSAILKKSKNKKSLAIKPYQIKSNIFIFVNCLIENPAFTSQTKEELTTRVNQFGNKIEISDSFISRIMKTGIGEKIQNIVNANEELQLQRADGTRKTRVTGEAKLVDANRAGTKDSYKCTLILTEGDSALSLAKAGLAVIGRDYYGCFPLKGKLLNVREATNDQISKNKEIKALKQIIGLQHKKHYNASNITSLRYGRIMIMTDQDQDGSHIKGLIINFLETSFPGLLEIPGFLLEFITPIVKVTVKNRSDKQVIPFYNLPDFEDWRETVGKTCRWTHKYYKGLGTSTSTEAREYFAALDKHLKTFHALQGDDSSFIDLAFSKKKADERKEWLQGFQPGTQLDPLMNIIPISDFINKELILFSMADNIRSIPSVVDGFKPGQRKVLFGCLKRNLKSEIKVAQLAAYVSEHTGYHHGEQSLVQTIIGLAQNFVGSNNLNLLKPNGAFGTRDAGGKDFAAARYIFTEVNKITNIIFNNLDNPLYTYVQEDEQTVEPKWYLPVVPMILINGAEGIGTGWSTNIPSFNPADIVENIRRMMRGEEMRPLVPWYRGWTGDIEPNGTDRFKVTGRIEQVDDRTVEITELPVKVWTNNMKEFLFNGLGADKNKPWIKDVEEQHGISIRFVVKLTPEEMNKSLQIGLHERFKLNSSINLSNMVAFDPLGRIKKYSSPLEILTDFYYVRLEYYQKRKDFLTDDLQQQITRLSEQARFIKLIIDKQLNVANRGRADLIKDLEDHKFAKFDKAGKLVREVSEELFVVADDIINEEEEEVGDISQLHTAALERENEHQPETIYSHYDYLLSLSIWSLTKERYERMLNQKSEKEKELTELLKMSAKDLWNNDLDRFLVEWEKFSEEEERLRSQLIPSKGTKKTARGKRKIKSEKNPSEPPSKKASVKQASNVKNTKSATTSASASAVKPGTTHEPEVKKEEKQQPDVLSFFAKDSSASKNSYSKKSKPKAKSKRSMFTDSEDESDDSSAPASSFTESISPAVSKKSFSSSDVPDASSSANNSAEPKPSRAKRSTTPGKSVYDFDSEESDDVPAEDEGDEHFEYNDDEDDDYSLDG